MPSCHLEVQVQAINVSFTVAKMTTSGVHILKHKKQAFEIIQEQLLCIRLSYSHNNRDEACSIYRYYNLIIFGVYDISQKIVFEQVGVDLNKCIPECYYSYI